MFFLFDYRSMHNPIIKYIIEVSIKDQPKKVELENIEPNCTKFLPNILKNNEELSTIIIKFMNYLL